MVNVFNKVHQIKTAWKANASMRFLTWVTLSYVIWYVIYSCWLIDSVFTDVLTKHLAQVTTQIVRYIGIDAYVNATTISVDSNRTLFIGNACNGIEFFGIFACFILVYPIEFKYKWWFIIAGILSIHVLNIIRLVLLVIIYSKSPGNFDFNHKYTFVIIIYGLMFWAWFHWAKKYRLES